MQSRERFGHEVEAEHPAEPVAQKGRREPNANQEILSTSSPNRRIVKSCRAFPLGVSVWISRPISAAPSDPPSGTGTATARNGRSIVSNAPVLRPSRASAARSAQANTEGRERFGAMWPAGDEVPGGPAGTALGEGCTARITQAKPVIPSGQVGTAS